MVSRYKPSVVGIAFAFAMAAFILGMNIPISQTWNALKAAQQIVTHYILIELHLIVFQRIKAASLRCFGDEPDFILSQQFVRQKI